MKFTSALDELEYWMQRLSLELQSHTAIRHLVALERLCELFANTVRKNVDAPRGELSRRLRLSTDWTALQKRVEALREQAEPPPPSERRAGKFRVIDGGRPNWKFRRRTQRGSRGR